MLEKSGSVFVEYLRHGKEKPELRALTTAGIQVSNEMSELLDHEARSWPVQQLATTYRTERNMPKVSIVMSDAEVQFFNESDAYGSTNPIMAGFSLELHKIGGIVVASEELIQDSGVDVELLLARSFGRSLSVKLEDAFINGDGIGKPKGFVQDCQIVSAAGSTVVYGDIESLYKSLDEKLLPNASWLVNRETLALLSKLSDGSGSRCLIPDTTGETAGYLFGKPTYVSFLPPEKPIAFGDFSQYVIVEKPATIRRLVQKYGDYGQVGFLFQERLDGRLFNPDAVLALEMGE